VDLEKFPKFANLKIDRNRCQWHSRVAWGCKTSQTEEIFIATPIYNFLRIFQSSHISIQILINMGRYRLKIPLALALLPTKLACALQVTLPTVSR
jgi:hypothetical protein